MAFLILKGGKPVTVKSHIAKKMWLISTGELIGTEEETAKAKQVEKFYFSRDNAPKSWLDKHVPRNIENSGLGGKYV